MSYFDKGFILDGTLELSISFVKCINDANGVNILTAGGRLLYWRDISNYQIDHNNNAS